MAATSKSASSDHKGLEYTLGAPSPNRCLIATTNFAYKQRLVVDIHAERELMVLGTFSG